MGEILVLLRYPMFTMHCLMNIFVLASVVCVKVSPWWIYYMKGRVVLSWVCTNMYSYGLMCHGCSKNTEYSFKMYILLIFSLNFPVLFACVWRKVSSNILYNIIFIHHLWLVFSVLDWCSVFKICYKPVILV